MRRKPYTPVPDGRGRGAEGRATHVHPPASRFSVYSLYWYKSTNTDADAAATAKDRQALWDNMEIIDVFSSHHAPHTKEEKLTQVCLLLLSY